MPSWCSGTRYVAVRGTSLDLGRQVSQNGYTRYQNAKHQGISSSRGPMVRVPEERAHVQS